MATAAILNSFLKSLEALDLIADDQSQKGDTRRETNNIAHKMQDLEMISMLKFWNYILQKTNSTEWGRVDIHGSLTDQLCISRVEFERYETATKEMLPDVDYKAAQTRKRIKKTIPNGNDGDVPKSISERYRNISYYHLLHNCWQT